MVPASGDNTFCSFKQKMFDLSQTGKTIITILKHKDMNARVKKEIFNKTTEQLKLELLQELIIICNNIYE